MMPTSRKHVVASAVGVLLAVLFVSVASSDPVALFERYPDLSFDQVGPEIPPDFLVGFEETEREEADVFKVWEVDLPDFLDTILQVLLVGGLIALMIRLWQRRPRLRWRRARVREEFDVLDDLPSRIAAEAAAQRAALASGQPRNAIVACWLRLETLAAETGFERHPADTSEEFTERILVRFDIDQGAIAELAALYREARFSSHPIGEPDRDRAVAALETIHASLTPAAAVTSSAADQDDASSLAGPVT